MGWHVRETKVEVGTDHPTALSQMKKNIEKTKEDGKEQKKKKKKEEEEEEDADKAKHANC
jgi:hypothetical protein